MSALLTLWTDSEIIAKTDIAIRCSITSTLTITLLVVAECQRGEYVPHAQPQ